MRELCQAVIALARERRIPVLVDPKGRDFGKYAGATTICPNLQELGLVTGISSRNLAELLARGATDGSAAGHRLHDRHHE